MGQVTVTLNAKTYRLRCGDGQEQRLAELAEHVGQRIEQLASQFGQFGDERLLLMAALLITDDMLDLKERLDRLEGRSASEPVSPPEAAAPTRAETRPSVETASVMPVSADGDPPRPASEPPPLSRFEAAPEPQPAPPAPSPRRGSLEARLAQARVGSTSKTNP